MSVQKKIRILETEYIEGKDLVYWTVLSLEDSDAIPRIAMRGVEMMEGFGITAKVDPEQMKEFLLSMKGKELNWIIESRIKEDIDPKTIPDETLERYALDLDQDPFFEVIEAEKERDLGGK